MYHTDGNTGCIQTTDFSIMYKPVKKKLPGNKKYINYKCFVKDACMRRVGAPSLSHIYTGQPRVRSHANKAINMSVL